MRCEVVPFCEHGNRARKYTRTYNKDVIKTENESEEPMKEDMTLVERYRFHDNFSMQ